MWTSFTAPAYVRLLGTGQFKISLDYPGPGRIGHVPGPAIILPPVDHWCCDDPDIINIGDLRKFHTFDQKTAWSEFKGYLCFLSKKFDPLKFFCPVHHSSPVNVWVWVVKSEIIFDVFCSDCCASFLCMEIIRYLVFF